MSQDSELLRRVSEETDFPTTTRSVLTGLSPIPIRMQPTLENPMCELARVTFLTIPFAKLRTRRTRIMVLQWVPTTSLLTRMRVRALRPIMRPRTCAPPNLKLVHPKMVARERVLYDVRKRVRLVVLVRRQVTVEGGEGIKQKRVVSVTGIGVIVDGEVCHWRRNLRRLIVEWVPRRHLDRLIWISNHHRELGSE